MAIHHSLFVAVLIAEALALSAEGDICATYTDCLACAGINGCGWCSTPITYPDGSQGAHCASPQTTGQFKCSGIYSTDQCLRGYVCDQAAGTCRLADPGQGTSFEACNVKCTVGPAAKVYGCLNGTKSCVVVPPGTPGSGSMEECEKQCIQPPAKVYKCNASNQCAEVPAGTPGSSSLEVCQAEGCNGGNYGCDLSTYTCRPNTGTMSNASCTKDCRPPNDPCAKYTSCPTCLAGGSECGWCSTNVTYASGQAGGQCAGVSPSILPFNCKGTFSTTSCSPAPTPTPPTPPPTPSPYIPPYVDCPPGSMVMLQYNCKSQDCQGCNSGPAAMCMEPHCTMYCSGKCQPVPAFGTSFMWSCNENSKGQWTNATLVHFLKSTQCEGPVNPPGTGGSGTYPLGTCGMPFGPNNPPQYNTFMCVPCGASCNH